MKDITTISVETPSAAYNVEIGAGILASVGARLNTLLDGALHAGKQRAFVLTSPEIWRLWGDQLAAGFSQPLTPLFVPAGEQHKRLIVINRLAEELAQHGADRDSLLIALGGGVIGDMAGFLAAIYMRGIRYIQVPTTALAQIDSSIGGKTGVNLVAGKNLAGAFYHPLAVFSDTDTLRTLPSNELRAGLQEAVKAGIIRDPALFDYMEANASAILSTDPASMTQHQKALTHVVAASVRVKADVVAGDEREAGLRMILNLGHTLGHAIEAATGYTQLLHGEAVAWGMIAAIRIAAIRSIVSAAEADRMYHVIRLYGPLRGFIAHPPRLVALTAKDKKNRSGTRSFVLPLGIGNAAVVRDVTDAELLSAAEYLVAEAAPIRIPG
jgi:3-dehydroquinate synthase